MVYGSQIGERNGVKGKDKPHLLGQEATGIVVQVDQRLNYLKKG